MNILIVTAYAPVLHMHGGGVRMYHNIRILSSRHRVRVISFVESDDEMDMLQSLRGICESVKGIRRVPDFSPHWLSVLPFMVREFSTPEMHHAVDSALESESVDVLQCEYLQMAQFRRRGVFSVLTEHEVLSKNAYEAFETESDPTEKLRSFYRWMQILRYEALEVAKFDRVVTMTPNDADYLRSYAPQADIRAIPIGIDPVEFTPLDEAPEQPIVALFVGNFRHSPNVEAARFIVRSLAPRFPEVQFLLPGSHVPADLHPGPNVVLPGYAPDTRVLYRRPNTIVLAPLFSGTGQRVKLLEAFSMACPVITTTVGAMGFPIETGVQAIIADNVDQFESGLKSLIAACELRRNLGQSARKMIMEQFAWDQIGRDLLAVVENRPRIKRITRIKTRVNPRNPRNPRHWKVLKVIAFVWRFVILFVSTAYREGTRD
jgi:glycosyltransferase involved in cell wall biosynthesis